MLKINSPFTFILASALTASVIAPLSLLSEGMSPALLLFIASTIALILHLPFAGWGALRQRSTYGWGALLGVCAGMLLTVGLILFAYSLRIADNAIIPAIVFEIYPIILIIMTALFYTEERLGVWDISWSAIAFAAVVALMIQSRPGVDLVLKDLLQLNNVASVLSVSIFSVGVFLVTIASRAFGERETAPFLASGFARLGGVLVSGITVLFDAPGQEIASLGFEQWGSAILYGLLVIGFSNIFYYKGVYISQTSFIQSVMFFGPLLGVILLYFLGFGQLTPLIGISASLVILANVMIHLQLEDKPSYKATIISAFAAGVAIYYFDGQSEIRFFEAISGCVLFFALLYGFMIDKLNRRVELEEASVIAFLNSGADVQDKDQRMSADKRGLIEALATGNNTALQKAYRQISRGNDSGLDHDALDTLLLSRSKGLAVGETFVLILTGLLCILTALAFRPAGFYYDIFGLVVITSVTFVSLTIFDAYRDRKLLMDDIIPEIDENSVSGHDFIVKGMKRLREENIERLITIGLLIALFGVFATLYLFKHNLF